MHMYMCVLQMNYCLLTGINQCCNSSSRLHLIYFLWLQFFTRMLHFVRYKPLGFSCTAIRVAVPSVLTSEHEILEALCKVDNSNLTYLIINLCLETSSKYTHVVVIFQSCSSAVMASSWSESAFLYIGLSLHSR